MLERAFEEYADLAEDAEQLARRVLEYVGDDTIEKDDFLDADRELQTMARAILVRLGKRPDKAVGGED